MTGPIPTELDSLANLEELFLSENLLSGCIPQGLRDVAKNDLRDINLPFCDLLVTCGTEDAASDVTDNSGLVADCEALLSARDTFDRERGAQLVGWNAHRSMGRRHRGRLPASGYDLGTFE